jgi:hypothetical protein
MGFAKFEIEDNDEGPNAKLAKDYANKILVSF